VHAARALGLAPCAPAEADRLLQPERLARGGDPHELFGLALAQFRAAQWAPALATLQESAKRDPLSAWRGWPLMAMIQHHLGRAEEAPAHLARSKQRLDQYRSEEERSTRPRVDEVWFDFEVVYREADALIGAGGK
jgi:hypothetical protein